MTTWMRIIGLCLGTSALMACSATDTAALDEATDTQDDSIYAASSTLWKSKDIPVCWENAGDNDAQRWWVQDQITKTWDAVSSVNFTGWGKCQNGSSGIRINIDDSGPHTKGLGNQIDGVAAGMVLNFTFNNWSPACHGQEEFCIRSIAAHEFGHALGFAHEQNRKDKPGNCSAESQGGDGDLVVGSWDLDSVMNYCNPAYNGNGNLSQTDIDGVRIAYDQGLNGLIVNEFDDRCLDVYGASQDDGAPVVAHNCNGGNNQRWSFEKRGDGFYQIVSRSSGKCLDVTDWSKDNGGRIQQWSCSGGDNQAWAVETGGSTRLIAKQSGRCLDLTGWSLDNAVPIQQWDCHDGDNQKWSLKN
ncbi:MAG: RICIN domain-containing protein [Byssovorax sp.]